MKFHLKYYIIGSLCCSSFLYSGCREEFEEVNLNPNAPEQVSPQFLLPNVLYQAAKNNSEEGWKAGNLLAQQTSNLEFLPIDRYDLGSNTRLWENTYRLLNDLESMREGAQGNTAYEGVAMVMKANLAALLTDLYGDVPYSEAVQGRTNKLFTPAYDKQEAIYTGKGGILELLRNAEQILEKSRDPLNGDIMYNGDLDKWVRFANSLRVRYLMRISKKINVAPELQNILTKNKLISGNSASAVVPFLASAPNQWFIFNEREGRYSDVRMSKTIDSVFQALNDPRLAVYFKPTEASKNSATKQYAGLPNGLSLANQNGFNLNNISTVGALFRDIPDGVNAHLMQYSELQFLLAEAALKGYISGSAASFYQAGIQASFDYYRTPIPAGYLERANVKLSGTDDLRKIMTQKWLSHFMNGYEAWLDIRRTGFPQLKVAQDNLNNNVYPVRFRYPESEQAANSEKYQAALTQAGPDTYNRKGWWESD